MSFELKNKNKTGTECVRLCYNSVRRTYKLTYTRTQIHASAYTPNTYAHKYTYAKHTQSHIHSKTFNTQTHIHTQTHNLAGGIRRRTHTPQFPFGFATYARSPSDVLPGGRRPRYYFIIIIITS